MTSFEHRIDALGGVPMSASAYDIAFNEGHHVALTAACEIAEDADAMIAELLETIEDMLSGGRTLKVWTESAETLVRRVKGRVS